MIYISPLLAINDATTVKVTIINNNNAENHYVHTLILWCYNGYTSLMNNDLTVS